MLDLIATLKLAYLAARNKGDRRAMDMAATAISYAASGSRDLARELALKLAIKDEKQRKEQLRQWSEYVDSIEDRLARAKEQLGDRYLLAPTNRVQRRSTPYGSIR
jgi:hypothetical protein